MQRDVLLCSATVREAITTSALLRLPRTMSHAEKKARVEEVIKWAVCVCARARARVRMCACVRACIV